MKNGVQSSLSARTISSFGEKLRRVKLDHDAKLLFSTFIVIVLAIAASWIGLGQARNIILKKEGHAAAVGWAHYLANNLQGLDALLSDGRVTEEDRQILDFVTTTGSVLDYRILNASGATAFSSRPDDVRVRSTDAPPAAALPENTTYTELVTDAAGSTGQRLIAEAYIPIKSGSGNQGAVSVRVDLSARSAELQKRSVYAFLAVLGFVVIIGSLCGVLVWMNIRNRRSAEELQKSRNIVLEQLATGMPLEQVLMTLAQSVERLKRDTICSILLLDEDGVRLRDAASPSLPEFYRKGIDGVEIGPYVGSCGAAAYTREIVIVSDILNHPNWAGLRAQVLPPELRACWSRPVISSSNEVLGTIALYYRQRRAPSQADLEFFRTISHLVGIAVEQRRFQDRIAYLAHCDTMTGLPNRRELQTKLQKFVEEAREARSMMALAIVDIDKFKTINDTYGHPIGDEVIREAARRISESVRSDDMVGRLGGDELAIVFREISDIREIAEIAGRIGAALQQPMQIGGKSISASISIGVSCFPEHADNSDELFIKADHALYQAKQSGRATYEIYDKELHELIRERQALEHDAAIGIQRNEFSLVYQPQIDLRSGALVGLEALARWHHPLFGEVPPAKFIPVAEASPIIIELGEQLLREACDQAARWHRQGLTDVHVAVNVTARQFKDPLFVEKTRRILEQTNLKPTALELEITETLLIDDLEVVEATLRQINALGCTVSIDDFGTGYSSLQYLSRLPFNRLKIDASFVKVLPGDASSAAIVRAILAMAGSLGLSVVAEGVQTCEQAEFLRLNGCGAGQGHLFARAMEPATVEKWLQTDLVDAKHFCLTASGGWIPRGENDRTVLQGRRSA